MSYPEVLETLERRSGKRDFILSAGREGKERVRVVLTLWKTFACMTCRTTDACVHAEVARDYHAAHPEHLGAEV
jgi:hypothetical protein